MSCLAPIDWKQIRSGEDFVKFCAHCDASQLNKLIQKPAVKALFRQYARHCSAVRQRAADTFNSQHTSLPKQSFMPKFMTPLYAAAERGLPDVVRILLANGASVNDMSCGAPPLWIASQFNHVEVVKLLLSCPDVDPNLPVEMDESTSLLLSARLGHADVVHELLAHPRTEVRKARGKDGAAPLLISSLYGHTKVVEQLLKKDSSSNHVNIRMKNGTTPLAYAAGHNHVQIAKLLLAAKADVNAQDKYGCTPLRDASQHGLTDIVELLLKADDIKLNYGTQSPLWSAAKEGHSNIVRMLLSAGADPTHKEQDGSFPLLAACQGGHADTVTLLLDASPYMINERMVEGGGTTGGAPLHFCAQHNQLACAKILLSRGADVNLLDKGQVSTPLMVAATRGHFPLMKLLIESGAGSWVKNKEGRTVYDYVKDDPIIAAALARMETSPAMPPVTMSMSELKALPVQKLKSILAERYLPVPKDVVEKEELAAYILKMAGSAESGSGSASDAVPASDAQPLQPSPSRACLWCGSQAPKLKLCGGCKSVWICSKDCQKASWQDHRGECKTLRNKGVM